MSSDDAVLEIEALQLMPRCSAVHDSYGNAEHPIVSLAVMIKLEQIDQVSAPRIMIAQAHAR